MERLTANDGVTGDLPFLDRPGGKRLLTDAASGKFKTALVYLYDRFSRDVYEGIQAYRLLKAAGCQPFSINEPYDLDLPHGQYMFVQSLNNAQLGKAQLLQRTAEGRERKVREGYWVGGSAPFGYRIVGKSGRRIIEPDEETILPGINLSPAATVRWIFEEIAHGGATLNKIAIHFNALSVPTWFMFNQRNPAGSRHLWTPTALCRIIHSRTYIGTYTYGKVQKSKTPLPEPLAIACPPIVSPDLWQAAQEAVARNATANQRNTRAEYLLRGLLRCGICGNSYIGRIVRREEETGLSGNRGKYYLCTASYGMLRNYGKRCESRAIGGAVEREVWAEVTALLTDTARIRDHLRDFEEAQTSGEALTALNREREAIESALVGKEGERSRLLEGYRKQLFGDEELKEQRAAVSREEAALKDRLGEIEKRMQEVLRVKESARAAAEVLSTLRERIQSPETLTFAERRQILAAVIEQIIVLRPWGKDHSHDTLRIHWRFAGLSAPLPKNKSVD